MSAIESSLVVVIVLVALALAFDFMNGFHDAANSIATIVSTGVLKPHQAVAWAATFNIIAIFVFHLKVATTIGKGTIDPAIVDHHVVFGALVGAITWNVITWYYAIPSSSSHALIGGLVGAALAKSGVGALVIGGVMKTVAFIVVSPVLGFFLGSLMMVGISHLFFRPGLRRQEYRRPIHRAIMRGRIDARLELLFVKNGLVRVREAVARADVPLANLAAGIAGAGVVRQAPCLGGLGHLLRRTDRLQGHHVVVHQQPEVGAGRHPIDQAVALDGGFLRIAPALDDQPAVYGPAG